MAAWEGGNRDELMGKYGFKERNKGGQMVVDFARRIEMDVVDTHIFKESGESNYIQEWREEHLGRLHSVQETPANHK